MVCTNSVLMTKFPRVNILGIGTITVDHVMSVSRYPEPDSKNDAIRSRYQVGGPVPIALSQLRRFGHSATFVGAWGDDAWGKVIEERLQREAIEFPPDCRSEAPSSVTQIWLEEETGQRTLVTQRVERQNLFELIDEDTISQFEVLHLDCWPTGAALKAARLMKAKGGLVTIDTGSPKPGVEKLLPLADIVNCPERFCKAFTGETDMRRAVELISQLGPKFVTATAGEKGAVLAHGGQVYRCNSMKIREVVDTNGAGDSFSGALVHGVLSKWEPEFILSFATACAGLKCQHLGNEEALRDESEVLTAMPDKSVG